MYDCVFSVQDSFEEQATQGSFVPHGRQDVLTAAIGHPEHPGHVRATGADVTIKQVLYSYYMFLIFELIHSVWLKLGHLTLFHEQAVVSLAKPPQKPHPKVDDPLYLMTLTIPKLF